MDFYSEIQVVSTHFSKTLGGPLNLGGIFQNPGWKFSKAQGEVFCLPPTVYQHEKYIFVSLVKKVSNV